MLFIFFCINFDNKLQYWRITDKNEKLIGKTASGDWDIQPETAKFYETGKYYYFSKTYQKDVLDYSDEMKTWEHEDIGEYDDNKNVYEINVTEASETESFIINAIAYTIVAGIFLSPAIIIGVIIYLKKRKNKINS